MVFRKMYLIPSFLAIWVFASILSSAQPNPGEKAPILQVEAVVIKVPNLAKAKDFYLGVLGFNVDKANSSSIVLSTNSYKIILEKVAAASVHVNAGIGKVNIALQVNDLDSAYRRLKDFAVRFVNEEPRKEGVGFAYKILDPFGNHLSIIRLEGENAVKVPQPWIYNCGLFVEDIDRETELMTALGFKALTAKYLPMDNPLFYDDGKFAFVLHRNRPEYNSIENNNVSLVFKGNVEYSKEILRKIKTKYNERKGSIFFSTTSRCPVQILSSTGNER